jgi:nucleotide-binding universal stress UspA family protein
MPPAGRPYRGGVTILSVIPPEEFQHWMGVADLMRAEARERIEAHFEVFAKWMRDKQGVNPELVIREGDPVTEILGLVNDDPRSACWSWVRAPKRPGPARWSRR